MKPGPRAVDHLVTVTAAVTAPVLLLLVDTHVLSSVVATDVASIVAAAVASYHGGQQVGKRKVIRTRERGGA